MYNDIYQFVIGPLAWFGWAVFILGSIYKLVYLRALSKKKDVSSLAYTKFQYGLRSIIQWMIPFGTLGWQANPQVTVVTFIFHICLLVTPIFLSAHVVLWDQFFGVSWPTLPGGVADIMTVIVILGCCFFAYRRFAVKEVVFVTGAKDWWTLILVVSPFITGILANYQIFNYQFMIVLHILCGLAWLALIPFTRLSHVILSWYSRAYIGSEFQGVRHCKDW